MRLRTASGSEVLPGAFNRTGNRSPTTSDRSDCRLTVLSRMRLIVARCSVVYSGRLNAVLPESLRLLIFKSDGSVLVHADAGGYKPLNWMTPLAARGS